MTNKIRENLQASWIEYLSFSSMKELRNNEALFLKHYINYEWDNGIYLATIIWKACHHAVEHFLEDQEMRKLFEKKAVKVTEKNKDDLSKTDPQRFVMDRFIKVAQDYAKDEYIAKNQKPEEFWKSKEMIKFGWYVDLVKLVDDYKKLAEEINAMWENIPEEKAVELEKAGEKIKKCITKHQKKDAKLDDFIKYGSTWSIDKILDGIKIGLENFFNLVYPKVKNWKLLGTEYNQTMDVCDLDWVILDLPLKFIIDAVFEDENWDLIIVDWKFKSQLSDTEILKPDYDMQWSTYFFGCFTAFGKKPKEAIFIEVQPAEAKPTVYLQADLRKLCDENKIDWAKWNNGKWMTNPMMQKALIDIDAIELKPVVNEYKIDFTNQAYLLDMWLILYRQTIKRLFQLLVENDDFVPNIFDQSFDGGLTVYQEWLDQFKPKDEPEYTEEDAVDL